MLLTQDYNYAAGKFESYCSYSFHPMLAKLYEKIG